VVISGLLSGRKWIARLGVLHQLHFRLLPTDYGCLLRRRYQTTGSRPARFLLPVALLPVPAWRQTRELLPWNGSPGTASGFDLDLRRVTTSGRSPKFLLNT